MNSPQHFRSIFISDIHLGTKFSKADILVEFLRDHESQNLYLVGDIIDGWAIKRKFVWMQSHSDVIQKILKKARKNTNVYFIAGNHDEFLRPFVPILLGDRLKIVSEMEYIDLRGKRYLITHGDFFDSITITKRWLAVLGDYGYDLLLHLNGFVNFCRHIFGVKKYWSLSKYAKDSIKSSISFISDYEGILANHAKRNEYDGVICGHIHKAEMRQIDGVEYFNCIALFDTQKQRLHHINAGENLKKFILASCALVPVFKPVKHEDMLLIDGGIVDNFPIEQLQKYAYPIVGINLYPSAHNTPKSIIGWTKKVVYLSWQTPNHTKQSLCHSYISSQNLHTIGTLSLGDMKKAYAFGREEMLRVLDN